MTAVNVNTLYTSNANMNQKAKCREATHIRSHLCHMAIAKSDSNRGFFDPSLKLVFLPYHQAVS